VKNKFKKLLVNFIQKKKIDKDIIVSDDIVNIVNLDSVNSDLQSIFRNNIYLTFIYHTSY